MQNILVGVLYFSLATHLVLMAIAIWRVWRGENVIDRLIGVELVSTVTLAIVVLIALITRESIYIDVALALGALGFIGMIAFAKYAADERMF